jgi:cobalt/nickel transport system ATP-binding protein
MKIGFLFQNPDDQILSMTVKEEISFALENMGYKHQQIEEKLDNIVHKLNIDFSLEKEVIKLSFGQKRKVALASILIYEPEILLLDEPTAGLDPKNIDELVEIIYKINEEGKTILIATNDIDFAKDISSYVILLKKDHTLGYKGKTSEVISNSQLLYENNLIRRSQLR